MARLKGSEEPECFVSFNPFFRHLHFIVQRDGGQGRGEGCTSMPLLDDITQLRRLGTGHQDRRVGILRAESTCNVTQYMYCGVLVCATCACCFLFLKLRS